MQNQGDSGSGKREDGAVADFPLADSKREVAERIKEALKKAGGPNVVSAKTGIPLRTLANYASEKSEPKIGALVRIASACGVSLDWLAGQGDQSTLTERVSGQLGDEYVLVPRYNVQASAGNGSVIYSEQIVDYLAFKADWVRGTLRLNPAWLLLIEAVGDSMEGTISDGDLLLVNTQEPRIRENAVYAINVKGNLLVKRVQVKLDGSLVVSSDNPRYAPETIPPVEADHLRVIGQVIWHGGLMK